MISVLRHVIISFLLFERLPLSLSHFLSSLIVDTMILIIAISAMIAIVSIASTTSSMIASSVISVVL